MKERGKIAIVIAIFVIMGAATVSLSLLYGKFNFYKSELTINGMNISEKLFYKPNKDYHTLYRNFESPLSLSVVNNFDNYVIINNVKCQEGQAYMQDSYMDTFKFPEKAKIDLAYTKENEYGCGFGNELGFKKGSNYWIEAEYELKPKNIFKIKDSYYIKFNAYSKNRHNFLVKGSNFIVNGNAEIKKYFSALNPVVIYIPYDGDISGFNIIEEGNFKFRSNILYLLILIIFALSPAILVFASWYFFGREKSYEDIPDALSAYPKERKGWEIAAFFNPPFASIDKNFSSTMLLELYRRKVIDIKMKDKDMFIKINNKKNLDNEETAFVNQLELIKNFSDKKYLEGEYFNIEKATISISSIMKNTTQIEGKYLDLAVLVDKESKKYMGRKGLTFLFLSLFGIIPLAFLTGLLVTPMLILFISSLSILTVIAGKSALFVSFKEDYYIEYQHWQAFKKWLSGFPSMRESPPNAVVLWEKYLVYAAALGVEKQVAKGLKNWGVIDNNRYTMVIGVSNFSSSSSIGGGSSSGGGGGGGGVGGGGGGGR